MTPVATPQRIAVPSPAPEVASAQQQPPTEGINQSIPPNKPPDSGNGTGAWSNLFKGSLTAKGVSLGFVAAKIVDGKTVAHLDPALLTVSNAIIQQP